MTSETPESSVHFCLASASPRRREILSGLGLRFIQIPVDVNEAPLAGEDPYVYVQRMAAEKANAGLLALQEETSLPVLGADTTVVFAGRIMGKPENTAEAVHMLQQLSGQWHEVMTSVCVVNHQHTASTVTVTRVKFRLLDDKEIEAYCETGEPADKAGAYGVQGLGSLFVERIEGSYPGVVGLPVSETMELLAQFGINALQLLKEAGFDR
jgi:septum formation protein